MLYDRLPFGISASSAEVMRKVWQNVFVVITCGLVPEQKPYLSCAGNYSMCFAT